MSTTLLIGRWPAAISRAFSHSGDGPDRHVREHAGGEPRAELRDLHRDRRVAGHVSLPRRLRIALPWRRDQRGAGECVDLAGHSVDAEAVDAVGVDLELEHRLGDRQDRPRAASPGAKSPSRTTIPSSVVAHLQLGLGQDHPVGHDAPQASPGPASGRRASPRRAAATATVWPAATLGAPQTIVRVPSPVSTSQTLQAVGVRMLLRRDHPADDEALRRRRADVVDPLDLGRAHGEPFGELLDGDSPESQ